MILRLLSIALFLLWALFLVWLLTYGKGDLIRLLHPRLWWVLGVAVIVLILFLASSLIPSGFKERTTPLLIELPGIFILLIPLLYFVIARDARLDETSLQNRIIQNDSGIYINNLPSFEIFDESTSSDMSFSKILREPNRYENQDVEIVCQSFVNENLPENVAMCYRYLITCCAADAMPVFFFLSHQAQVEIENDQWVKVNGPLSVIRRNGMEFPSVTVDTLEYVEEPAFPWAM